MLFSPVIFSCLIKKGRAIRPLPILNQISHITTAMSRVTPMPIPISPIAIATAMQWTTAISWSFSAMAFCLFRFSSMRKPISIGNPPNNNPDKMVFIRHCFWLSRHYHFFFHFVNRFLSLSSACFFSQDLYIYFAQYSFFLIILLWRRNYFFVTEGILALSSYVSNRLNRQISRLHGVWKKHESKDLGKLFAMVE